MVNGGYQFVELKDGKIGYVNKSNLKYEKELYDLSPGKLTFYPITNPYHHYKITIDDIVSTTIPKILKIINPMLWKKVYISTTALGDRVLIRILSSNSRRCLYKLLITDEVRKNTMIPMEFKDGCYPIPLSDFLSYFTTITFYEISKEEYEGRIVLEMI